MIFASLHRIRIVAISFAAVAILALSASQAHASLTFGTDPPPGASVTSCGVGPNCNYAIDTLPGGSATAQIAGIVTSVRVWHTGGYSRGAIRVVRPAGVAGFLNVEEQAVSFPANADPSKATTIATRFSVIAGDRIGIGWSTPGGQALSLQFVPAGTSLFTSGTLVAFPPGGTQSFSTGAGAVAISAVLDDSQDACPKNAALHVGCPKPAVFILKPRTQKYSKLAVTQSVTVDSSVATTATVKIGKKSLSSRIEVKTLKAGTAAIFKLRFVGPVRQAIFDYLKKHKTLKATITSTVSNTEGNGTAIVTAKLRK
jgi:hypothetical protein